MKFFKKIILSAAMLLGLAAGMVAPLVATTVYADDPTSVACSAISGDSGCNDDANSGPSINTIIKVIINILSFVGGIIAVIMIIVGGIRYTTSGGDSNKVSSAKNTIIYSLLGVVVIALAQFMVQYVFTTATSTQSTQSNNSSSSGSNKSTPTSPPQQKANGGNTNRSKSN